MLFTIPDSSPGNTFKPSQRARAAQPPPITPSVDHAHFPYALSLMEKRDFWYRDFALGPADDPNAADPLAWNDHCTEGDLGVRRLFERGVVSWVDLVRRSFQFPMSRRSIPGYGRASSF